jgi:hypothetical protein
MKTCTFINFMQALEPWLNDDYIQQARLDDKGNFTLTLVDGGQKVYHVDDCTAGQLKNVVELLKKNGVPVLK